jgi:hypothetical protein
MTRNRESGQALVLVLLSLSVVLTLVLFILARSVTDVAVSSRQEESVRAFSAAEAGIERSLVTGNAYAGAIDIGRSSYTTSVTDFALGESVVNFPSPISSGDIVTTWFVAHDPSTGNLVCNLDQTCFTGSSMDVCWGNSDILATNEHAPAIEVSIYYESTPGNLATIKIGRVAIDPNTGRRESNSFASDDGGTCEIAGQTYQFQKNISFASLGIPAGSYGVENGLQLAQIRMLYNDIPQKVGVNVTGGRLPSQGQKIDSSGVAGSSNRRVVMYQGWAESPFASNSLLVPSGITK